MHHDQSGSFRPLVAGAMLISIGPAAMLLMPMIVGVYVDELGFTNRQAGILAAFEAAGICVASLLGVVWVRTLNWRVVTLFGLGCAIIGNLVSIEVGGFTLMLVCRALASLGAGTAFAAAVASLGEQKKPETAFGIGLAVQTFLLTIIMAMSAWIIERQGIDGMFFMLAVLAFVVALPVGWLPARSEKSTYISELIPNHDSVSHVQVIFALIATILYYAGLLGFWVYLERIGNAAGHSNVSIGTILTWALAAGTLGGAGAAWLSDRKGIAWPLIASTLILIGMVLIAVGNVSAPMFALSAIVFSGMWVFTTAYQTALVAKLDRHGRYIVLVPAAQGAGAMLGPATASVFVQNDEYLSVNIITVSFVAIGLILFLMTMRGCGTNVEAQ